MKTDKMVSVAGFSLVEALVAMVIGCAVIGGTFAFQALIANDTKMHFQKIQALEFSSTLAAVFANSATCECNTAGLELVPDGPVSSAGSPKSYIAVFPTGRNLLEKCPSASGADVVLATVGSNLPKMRYAMAVTQIAVTDLIPVNGSFATATQYIGAVRVDFDTSDRFSNRARHIQPSKILQNFYVADGKIKSCGKAPTSFEYVYADSDVANNAPLETDESEARCPEGTRVVGGGWTTLDSPVRKAFCTDPSLADAAYSRPNKMNNSWVVLYKCSAIKAVAVCFRTDSLP